MLSIGVSVALIVCVFALPDPAPTLAHEVAANIAATDVGNPITAVLLAFRAIDTLLEAIVLVIALLGVWSLAPDGVWGGRPGVRQHTDPNGIFAYFARVLPPVGVVVAMYIFWAGADHPGGKFQAATILAAMWLLVLMTRPRRRAADRAPRTARRHRRWPARVRLLIGFIGSRALGVFLAYPEGLAKPFILFIEFALLPSLTLILGLLLLGAPRRGSG